MKKIMTLVLALVMVFALCACGAAETPAEETTTTEEATTQIANPWQDVESVAAAEELVGYGIEAPETVAGLAQTAVRAMVGENGETMIELVYGDNEIVIRKAPGADDVSGDYNTYAATEEVTVGDAAVTEKGDGENVFCAIWTSGDYAYAIVATAGIGADAVAEAVAAVK